MKKKTKSPELNRLFVLKTQVLFVLISLAMFIFIPVSVNAATKEGLRNKLSKQTSQKIYIFKYANLDRKGAKEAVALTADGRDEWGGYKNARLWYVSDKKCSCFYKSIDIYSGIVYGGEFPAPKLWKLKKSYMFKITKGGYGSGSTDYLWTFNKNGPKSVPVPGKYGESVTYKKNNDFCVTENTFDAFHSSDGHLQGHTHKNYYFHWNGKSLVEYGGLRITQAQLKKAKGAAEILNSITKKGTGNGTTVITDIFYRSNGIININYRNYYGGYEDWGNGNVTLKLKKGKITYDTSVNPRGKTKLEKATYSGIYKKSLSNKAKYPKKFPL